METRINTESKDEYSVLLDELQAIQIVAANDKRQSPMVRVHVDVDKLFDAYLDLFPVEQRQRFNCDTCRAQFKRYAGMVWLHDDGSTSSVMFPWSYITNESDLTRRFLQLGKIVENNNRVANCPVLNIDRRLNIGPKSNNSIKAVSGVFHHLGIAKTVYNDMPSITLVIDAAGRFQKNRKLFSLSNVQFLLGLSRRETNPLNLRSQHIAALNKLNDWLAEYGDNTTNNNIVFNRVVMGMYNGVLTAAVGSGIVAELFKDLGELNNPSSYEIEKLVKTHNRRLDQEHYMRNSGNVTDGQAEVAFNYLSDNNYLTALQRRVATVDDLEYVWSSGSTLTTENATQTLEDRIKAGLFANSKKAKEVPLVTLIKEATEHAVGVDGYDFMTMILPKATSISVLQRQMNQMGFSGFTTASDPESKPVFKWDDGSSPALKTDRMSFQRIAFGQVITMPDLDEKQGVIPVVGVWNDPLTKVNPNTKSVSSLLVLRGKFNSAGKQFLEERNGLFEETLISSLHPYRHAITKICNSLGLETSDEGAVGFPLIPGVYIRVYSEYDKSTVIYKITPMSSMRINSIMDGTITY